MKRFAVCLRGAVSKCQVGFTNSCIDLYTELPYVNYTACYNSYVKHVVRANPDVHFDVYIHCWSTDLEEPLCALYKPTASLFEDNRVYQEELQRLATVANSLSQVSTALSIKKSVELIDVTRSYDGVIILRPDVLLWKDMNLSTYPLTDDVLFVNAHENCNGDFHFVMTQNTALQFAGLYDSASSGNKPHMHSWIQNYVRAYLKKDIRMDDIVPGKHQEVMRKILECSVIPGHITEEQLKEFECKTFGIMKVFSNNVESNDFIIRIGLEEDIGSLDDEAARAISRWIGRKLLTVEPYKEGSFGPWCIMWKMYDDKDFLEVLVHHVVKLELRTAEKGFIIVDSVPIRNSIQADVIRSALTAIFPAELPRIEKIGISGVSEAVMARHWWSALRGGIGFKWTWMLSGDMSGAGMKEMSCKFGWDNYPPQNNPDGELLYDKIF